MTTSGSTYDGSDIAAWSWRLARDLLQSSAPRRWRHVEGVVGLAHEIGGAYGEDAPVLIAAAALIGVGWAPSLAKLSFPPLDGAYHLLELGVPSRLVNLVAHYDCARVEATVRNMEQALQAFEDEASPIRDALWYCDMSVGPDGQRTRLEDRLAELGTRYAHDPIAMQWLAAARPELQGAVRRTEACLVRSGAKVT